MCPVTAFNGANLVVAQKDIAKTRLTPISYEPISYNANNMVSLRLNRSNPIERIDLRLTGQYLPVTTDGVLKNASYGALPLIDRIEVKLDGGETRINIPGYALRQVSESYYGDEYRVAPNITAGTSDTFEENVTLPFDIGSYLSLLDAFDSNTCTIFVYFAAVDSMATAGTTHSVANVQVEVITWHTVGYQVGSPGGVRGPYLKHIIDYEMVEVTSTRADKPMLLDHSVYWSQFQFHCWDDGTLADTILNRVGIKVDTNEIGFMTDWLFKKTYKRDTLLAPKTGIKVYSVGKPGHLETVAYLPDASMNYQLTLDVTKTGSNPTITVIRDRMLAA